MASTAIVRVGFKLLPTRAMVLLIATTNLAHGDEALPHSFVPKDGFVPDKKTATLIAEAVLVPIYGQGNIDEQKPLIANRSNGKWIVSGQLEKGYVGGVATIIIDEKTGQILRVTHGR